MSSKASSGAALGLADVDRQPRLVAGPVEVDRVGDAAAGADRQVEAGQGVLAARAPGRRRRAAGAPRPRRGRSPRSPPRPRPPPLSPARPARASAAPASPGSAPAPATRRSGRCAARRGATIAPAPFSRSAPSSAARATMSPRSVTSRASTAATKTPATSSLSHSGARERSSSSASSVVTMRAIAGSGARLRPVAQLADRAVGDPQLDRRHPLAAGQQLLLLVGRGAGHGEHRARALDQRDAGVQHPRRGPRHGGQPGARLDRLGERARGAALGLSTRAACAIRGGLSAESSAGRMSPGFAIRPYARGTRRCRCSSRRSPARRRRR